MIDFYKYNFEVRVVIFGEFDFVYLVVRLVVENGVVLMFIVIVDVCLEFESSLREEVDELFK